MHPHELQVKTTRLRPAPPFDLARAIDFLGSFGPAEGEQALGRGRLRKAVRVGSSTVVFDVEQRGSIGNPTLSVRLWSAETLDAATTRSAVDRVGFFLSVDDDIDDFYERGRSDERFAPCIERLHGLHQVKFMTPFENACWAVLTQRNPVPVARRSQGRADRTVRRCARGRRDRHGAFPAPADLAGVTVDELEPITRNRRRAEYLAAVIESWNDVDEHWLRTGPFDDVEAWLRGIKGIGEWSAVFVLFRGLGRGDRLPLTEPFIRAARAIYGARVSKERLRAIADGFGPWRGYWAMYTRAAA